MEPNNNNSTQNNPNPPTTLTPHQSPLNSLPTQSPKFDIHEFVRNHKTLSIFLILGAVLLFSAIIILIFSRTPKTEEPENSPYPYFEHRYLLDYSLGQAITNPVFSDIGDTILSPEEISSDARYVAINSHSDDVFMLSVDDISMTTGITHSYEPASVGSFIGYNVYIDGELKKTLTENSWVLPQLPDGVHTAEVSKIYNGGESERMAIDFGSVSGIENVQTGDVLITMLRNRRMRISGDYESATIWSADGTMVAQGITGNDIVELDTLPGGIYIVMATTKTGPVTKKIAL